MYNGHRPQVIKFTFTQCLGSGSVGSARFWLPGSGSGSGSAKICGSTDPNPKGKKQQKTAKKNLFLLQNHKSELLKNKKDYKNFLISEWSIKF